MKCDWKECRIGDIADVKRGSSPRPIHSFISTTGMPWVKIADATSDSSRYIRHTKEFIIEKGVSNSVVVEPETLIVSNSATPGLPKIMKIRACVHDGWLVFSDYKNVTRDYLYYKFMDIRRGLVNLANGSVFQNLKTEIVKDFKIELPPLETQRKIASILSSLDDKIELNDRINANLEEQAKAIFKSWFVDTENPLRKECRADEVFDISIGKTPPRNESQWFSDDPKDYIWVSISDMGSCGTYIANSSEYLTKEAVQKHNIKVIPDNTVLLSFKLTVGRVAITDGEMTTNEAIAHFKTDNAKIVEYLYCYLKNFSYQTMGSTSSIANAINSKIIKAMPFVVPTDDELTKFNNATASLFEKIKTNQQENLRLSGLRDALIPRLLSGELDVSKLTL